MLHACAERFDVTGNLENFLVFAARPSSGEIDPAMVAWARCWRLRIVEKGGENLIILPSQTRTPLTAVLV